MSGYFKVSVDAARAIAAHSLGPELLGAYLVVLRSQYGDRLTAAGAKSIATRLGFSDYRSKLLLEKLADFRVEGYEGPLFELTGRMRKSASVRRAAMWGEEIAYLPCLLPDGRLKVLLSSDDVEWDEADRRDALLVLTYIYAHADYARCLGVKPSELCWAELSTSPAARSTTPARRVKLGRISRVGNQFLWCAHLRRPIDWKLADSTGKQVLGGTGTPVRVKRAIDCLVAKGLLTPVIVVKVPREVFPIWISGDTYADSLGQTYGIIPDLTRHATKLAKHLGVLLKDEADDLFRDHESRYGSGFYYALAEAEARFLVTLVPKLYAPTPRNLDGLKELAAITKRRAADIERASPSCEEVSA